MKTKFLTILSSLLMVFAFGFSLQAQSISGTVSDDNGVPLPGATVLVEGTSNGVSTDFDGNYSISASSGDTLVFSFVGYSSQSVVVGSSATVDVSLQPDNALSEVVVTALGITREKKSLGYGITEIGSESINTVKDHNIANALVGKVSGLNITQSGTIGSGSRIVIRGNNSLSGNTQALIVVDGVPINQDGINSGGSVYNNNITGGGISDINPADVESVTILKGPNAAALYGSRAGNGVILVTTKKGTTGSKFGVTLNSNTTMDELMFLPDFQNTYGQGSAGNAATSISDLVGSSWGPKADGSSQLYYDGSQRAYVARPDNVKNFFETGVKTINSVAVDASTESTNYRFSYTNNKTESVLPGANLKSHNFNLRSNATLSDKLSIDTKVTFFSQNIEGKARSGGEGVIPAVYGMPRTVMLSDLMNYQMENPSSASDYAVISFNGKGRLNTPNPYWMMLHDVDEDKRERFFGFTKVNYEFTDWLSGFIRIGADITNAGSYYIRQAGHHWYPQGRIGRNNSKSGELNSEFLLTAKQDLTDDINMVLNVGGNMSKRTYQANSMFGESFKIPSKPFFSNTNTNNFGDTPQQIKKVNSLYGSANFAYDNWAYLDVSARNDWSSTLASDNRSYLYTSVNASLLLQDFIDPDRKVFDLFKVRGSVANVGNDTNPYQLVQTFSVPGQGYLGLTTLGAPSTRLNPNLKPENIESTEFGLELSMFENKLNFDLSIYNIKTTDLIFRVPVPAATGYSFFLENVGEVTNKGVELSLGGTVLDTGSIKWTTNVFASKNENELVSLIDDLSTLVYTSTNSGNLSVQAKVGGGIGDLYGTAWSKDDNGNHIVNNSGRQVATAADQYLGNAQPDWLGGWSNSFTFGKVNVNFLIDGRFGGVLYNQEAAGIDSKGNGVRTLQYRDSGVVLDAVTSSGAANTATITAGEYWSTHASIAENYVQSQTNVRLREFSVGTDLSIAESLGLDSMYVSVIGRNLFFFNKKADDIDPEAMLGTNIGGMGISSGNVPTLRSLGLNVTLKF
jgi:TonB-linked SusC/RagA family outer membrane protein